MSQFYQPNDPELFEGQLYCPTCGARFYTDMRMESDEPLYAIDGHMVTNVIVPWRLFVVCERGHKWSVKTITRALNEPDDVLLGHYLGEE